MNLLGVDVGFASKKKTTGLACRIDGTIKVAKTGTQWEERERHVAAVPYLLRLLTRPFCLLMRAAHTAIVSGCSTAVPSGTVVVRVSAIERTSVVVWLSEKLGPTQHHSSRRRHLVRGSQLR